jgi:hypothetical protein
MSLACEPRKPTPSDLVRQIQETNRNVGLSPVFNVNTTVTPCIESFTGPTYPCGNGGMCEPITGLTISSPCSYNLSVVDNFDITFDFTSGNTMYTGYTGEFCYSLLNSLSANRLTDTCTPYSGITGHTITRNLDTTEISSVDNTYRVRSWDKFTSKCLTNDLGVTGVTVDNMVTTNEDNDCYFITVVNPPQPILEYQPTNVLEGITFVNETLNVPEGSNQFLLSSSPIGGKVQLTINGLNVSSVDYTVDPTESKLITVNTTLESRDVVSAAYNMSNDTTNGVIDNVRLEFISVTGVTSGVTSSVSATTYENIVNFNNVSNRLEIYLLDKIDSGIQPRLTINGVNLTYNVDFFKSNIVQNKLILNEGSVIKVGDVISIYYYYSGNNNPGDLGVLKTDKPLIKWESQQNILRTLFSYGTFTLEVTDRTDVSFSNILYTGNTVYNNTTTSYTLGTEQITTTSIKDYIYRIKFVKNFVTDNPKNVYTTETYSDVGSFRLDWSYIKNTNF